MAELGISGLLLLFLLGLRHGLDPDHLALIDGMTLQVQAKRPALAPWVGFWFALGHGVVVTVMAMLVSAGVPQLELPEALQAGAEWLPVVLLFVVGTSNLLALRRHRLTMPRSWREWLLPRAWRGASHPLGIFLVGVFFATIFETLTQAATWGYVATLQGGISTAWLMGAVFTLGMLLTDTLDSRLVTRLVHNATPALALARRRLLCAAVAVLAYTMVLYSIISHFFPVLTLQGYVYSAIGLLLFAGSLLWWGLQRRADPHSAAEIVN